MNRTALIMAVIATGFCLSCSILWADAYHAFVSSRIYNGDIAGSSGGRCGVTQGVACADLECADMAQAAGLAGTWKAWLCDATHQPSGTFYEATDKYVRIGGDTVATNWNALTTTDLQNTINKTELGTEYAGWVWSNCNRDGTAYVTSNAHTCWQWTLATEGLYAAVGNSGAVSAQWSRIDPLEEGICEQESFPIYCFQQSTTVVEIIEIRAMRGTGGYVMISWETANEVDTVGFNVWRSQSHDGNYERINKTPIPSEGNIAQGALYEFPDTGCPAADCFYKLEDIDSAGVSTFHEPVGVEPAQRICGTSVDSGGMNHILWFVMPFAIIVGLRWQNGRREDASA